MDCLHLQQQRWGPSICHCLHRAFSCLGGHRNSFISSRILGIVIAGANLFKGHGEETWLIPSSSWGTQVQDNLQLHDFQVKFVTKHPRRWNAIGCLKWKKGSLCLFNQTFSIYLPINLYSGEICTYKEWYVYFPGASAVNNHLYSL